jgi:glycosyltransferase involved in cell wall biosynthesis
VISVIICTHNPRTEYITRALGALARQTLDRDKWELIVIDNASAERLDKRLDLSWHPHSRIVRENELGLTPARLRGIRESKGDVLVFVDDDNILAPEFLDGVGRIASDKPEAGAWSGSVTPEFDEPPPEWTRRYWGNLVIRSVGAESWTRSYFDESTPLGAGLCVRRDAAAEYLRLHDAGLRTRMLDRAGNSLVSGGDNDLAACALDLGMTVGVTPSLALTHIIPRERLSEDYLVRLIESIAYSGVILRSFRAATPNAPPRRGLKKTVDVIRRTRMSPRERKFTDAVKRGEMKARRELGI